MGGLAWWWVSGGTSWPVCLCLCLVSGLPFLTFVTTRTRLFINNSTAYTHTPTTHPTHTCKFLPYPFFLEAGRHPASQAGSRKCINIHHTNPPLTPSLPTANCPSSSLPPTHANHLHRRQPASPARPSTSPLLLPHHHHNTTHNPFKYLIPSLDRQNGMFHILRMEIESMIESVNGLC